MTRIFTIIFQVLAGAVQLGNYALDIVPEKYKWIVMLVVGVAQVFQAHKAHFTNPDGTPAAQPFVPKV